MTPAPLSRVIKVVQQVTHETDRARTVDMINSTMEMLARDQNLIWLYFKTSGCRAIQTFTTPCRNNRKFQGVVMPAGVKNIRELRIGSTLYDITEEEVPSCTLTRRNCNPKAEHMPTRLLEADVPTCDDSGIVMFQSDCPDDCGKLVGVRYLDLNLNEQREDIELGPHRAGTSVSVNQFLEITFPERMGNITVSTDNGLQMGKYHPSILAPVHEWFRLASGCAGQTATYRGLKEFAPYVFDTDPVPFSDKFLWELALKAREHATSMELTPAQTNGLARIFAQLAKVGESDMASDTDNFNTVVITNSAKSMLSTASVLSNRRYFGSRT